MEKDAQQFEKMTFSNSFLACLIGLLAFFPVQAVLFIIMSLVFGDAVTAEYGDLTYLLALGLVVWLVRGILRRKGIK